MTTELKLGSKHECPSCGTKFYDLGKADPVCPSCGAGADDEGDEAKGSSRTRSKSKKKKGK